MLRALGYKNKVVFVRQLILLFIDFINHLFILFKEMG